MSANFLIRMFECYLLTIAIETAVLFVGLSARHSIRVKVFTGIWLTACTYPVVWMVLPPFFPERGLYLLVAETFAPLAECGLFWFAFLRDRPRDRLFLQDMLAIVAANLASFGAGELIYAALEA